MFHSLFNVLAFGNYPNTFGVALQRCKFPTNEQVHINDICFSYAVNS